MFVCVLPPPPRGGCPQGGRHTHAAFEFWIHRDSLTRAGLAVAVPRATPTTPRHASREGQGDPATFGAAKRRRRKKKKGGNHALPDAPPDERAERKRPPSPRAED